MRSYDFLHADTEPIIPAIRQQTQNAVITGSNGASGRTCGFATGSGYFKV
jgi:hypothetical protein